MYNLNELHDPTKDYNGIAPYRSPYFSSIYQGLTIEIHIVDHCNLNCAGCNHFSPLAKTWYISLEKFSNEMKLLKENIPTMKELILLGGEPTMHPQLLELCSIAREYFPNPEEVYIRILSNGVNIKKLLNYKQEYKNLFIDIQFCNYPGYTDIKTIKELGYVYFATRNVSHQVLVDELGQQNKNQFFTCNKFRLPCLTIRDSKLFLCPFLAHLHHYSDQIILKPNIDFLDVNKIQNNLDIIQDFCFTPKDGCKYCIQDTQQWFWHQSSKKNSEYNISLANLYFKNYQEYYSIMNNYLGYFLKCYDENNPKEPDEVYATDFVDKAMKRLGKGKIDIIIPHYNLTADLAHQLIWSLQNQTIIKDCVIYFISDNSPNEEILIDLVVNSNLNYVLLKNQERLGPGAARNIGLTHSFNKYKFFLDADDYFYSDLALEYLYSICEENNFDVFEFMMYSNDNSSSNKANFLIHKDVLKNIKFNNLYFGEDFVFKAQLYNQSKNMYQCNNETNLFAVYNKTNQNAISNEIILTDTNHFNFITSRLMATQYKIDYTFYSNLILGLNSIFFNNRDLFQSDFNKLFLHWVYYKVYQSRPNDYIIINFNDSRIVDFQNHTFYITLTNEIITDINKAKIYINNYIKENYLNNKMTKAAAKYILSLD